MSCIPLVTAGLETEKISDPSLMSVRVHVESSEAEAINLPVGWIERSVTSLLCDLTMYSLL